MKYRFLGLTLVLVAAVCAISVYAFTTAEVRSGATVTIAATDLKLDITPDPSGYYQGVSGMFTKPDTGPGTGRVAVNFGNMQADSTYTFEDVVMVTNNSGLTRDITVQTSNESTQIPVTYHLAPATTGNCGDVIGSYQVGPLTHSTVAPGGQVCVSFSISPDPTAADQTVDLGFTISAGSATIP